jgi:hypothetical protein
MKTKISSLITMALVATGLLLWFGLGIGMKTPVSMPGYALVFLDDITKTYIALPCLEEWQRRPSAVVEIVRRSTANEAWQLHYEPDKACAKSGALFFYDDQSAMGFLLERVGILQPPKHWWNAPYRTEDGVVQPHE